MSKKKQTPQERYAEKYKKRCSNHRYASECECTHKKEGA